MKRPIGKKETIEADNGVVLVVKQEEYDEQKAKGWDDDEILTPGEHVFRRVTPDRVASLEDMRPSNTKVQITMKVDLDVLNHFKSRSQKTNAAPYQTQINSELRAIMDRDIANKEPEIDATAKHLLESDEFLISVSEKLREKDLIPS